MLEYTVCYEKKEKCRLKGSGMAMVRRGRLQF